MDEWFRGGDKARGDKATRHEAQGKRQEAIAAREREANRLWGRP